MSSVIPGTLRRRLWVVWFYDFSAHASSTSIVGRQSVSVSATVTAVSEPSISAVVSVTAITGRHFRLWSKPETLVSVGLYTCCQTALCSKCVAPRAQPRFKNWVCPSFLHAPSNVQIQQSKASRGEEWEGVSPSLAGGSRLRGLVECRKLPQRGLPQPQVILGVSCAILCDFTYLLVHLTALPGNGRFLPPFTG